MNYELTMFEELVYGKLSPFYSSGIDLKTQTEFLKENFNNLDTVVVGKFKKEKSRFVYQNKMAQNCIHPAAKNYGYGTGSDRSSNSKRSSSES